MKEAGRRAEGACNSLYFGFTYLAADTAGVGCGSAWVVAPRWLKYDTTAVHITSVRLTVRTRRCTGRKRKVENSMGRKSSDTAQPPFSADQYSRFTCRHEGGGGGDERGVVDTCHSDHGMSGLPEV